MAPILKIAKTVSVATGSMIASFAMRFPTVRSAIGFSIPEIARTAQMYFSAKNALTVMIVLAA